MTEEDTTKDAEADRTVIRSGRDYEETFRIEAAEAGRFLVALGEQLQAGEDVTLSTDEWELPFAVGDPVELEIDYEGVGESELEIEVTLPGRSDEDAPRVE
jgi:amphi-Trp domain-containing protein